MSGMTDRDKVISGLHCRAQDLITDLPDCDKCDYQVQLANRAGCDFRRLCKEAMELLKEQEIVRCKDCKHRSEETYTRSWDNKELYVCQIHDVAGAPDWFCADGERR